jgi:taurine transport system substrate-binding protein
MKKMYLFTFVWICLLAVVALEPRPGHAAKAAETLKVAYFPGWPGAFQVGWAKGWFEEALGMRVDFREFDTGAQITTAMASGDVQIAYALGTIPLCAAVSQGLDLRMVAISEIYNDAENLVVRLKAGINHPRDLIGKKLAVPYGTTAHYRLLGILNMFDIREDQVQIFDMPGMEMVAAFQRRDIDGGCTWEPTLSRMLEHGGKTLVSPLMQVVAGYVTYGTVSVTGRFAETQADLLVKFLQVVDRSIRYLRVHPDEAIPLIATKAGLDPKKTEAIVKEMGFITLAEQLTPAWLGTPERGGSVETHLKNVAAFLVSRRNIDKALPSYRHVIAPQFAMGVVSP